MSKKELLNYLLSSNSSITTKEILISLCCALIFSMIMYLVYKKTYIGVVYSKNFNLTLVLVAIITTIIMQVIGNNLALSLGMVGSLSIIRFRTAIKEPRDIAFVFWAICIGLSCGAQMYEVVFWGSLVIVFVLFVFSKDVYTKSCYLLVTKNSNIESGVDVKVQNIVKACAKRFKVRMDNTTGHSREVTYEIWIKESKLEELNRQLREVDTIDSYNIIAYSGEIVG